MTTEMDATGGQSLYPLHRCKTLHLVRHAQGIHNVAAEKDHSAYLSHDLFDAHITPLGWKQVDNLRTHVQASGLSKRIDLVVVSPLLRTMQTAVGVFGGEAYTDGVRVPPLMVANTGISDHPAISSLNCPPFLTVELCRERLGVHPCDKRRSIKEYHPLFPAIDFSLAKSDDDILWKPDIREKFEEVAARGMKFLNWLWTREEKEIAIVTHSGFLLHTLYAFRNERHPSRKSKICEPWNNQIVRRLYSMSESLTGDLRIVSFGQWSSLIGARSHQLPQRPTIYPEKIPHGLDLPSDVATEKHPEKGVPN
ncbi:hypothetical protein FH972_013833 [Carpinus fangiana]|uniref:Phosphoglycerate mutase-like protein n=1 Tax=Carpinus fangiana TaxID=176857 RepID=A0A5N6RBB7_9ROSI|nr:hypothetical protein FH972_013833 [Carpinus fangiana]